MDGITPRTHWADVGRLDVADNRITDNCYIGFDEVHGITTIHDQALHGYDG